MHSQHKFGKRSKEGSVAVDGVTLCWRLVSEPQHNTEGFKGLSISVQMESGRSRELILEYPFTNSSTKSRTNPAPKFPQRPKFSINAMEADVRNAIAAGWDPASRGKPFRFQVQ